MARQRASFAGPSGRASQIAEGEGYGRHRSSYRVNRSHDQHLTIGALGLPVVAVVFLTMAWAASPWGDGGLSGSVIGMIASGLAGLVFLGLTACVTVPIVVGGTRAKGAWVHVFDGGAIAERPRGNLYAWAHDRGTARYVLWRQAWDSGWLDRPQLWVSFRDGETICFDGRDRRDRDVLPDLARALGVREEPEEIGNLRLADSPPPF